MIGSVAVIGLGASGDAAARLALAEGANVHVTDASVDDPVAARGAVLRDLGADVRLGGHAVEEIAKADTVVVSPGIRPDAPLLEALRARGVRWISEPEFAFRFFASPLIAVTGTNGKTTTAAFCAHLLEEAGVAVGLGGNIGGDFGPPASALALLDPAPEWIVLELSSFQLADIDSLTPDVGVMTNLGSDHLDRYASVSEYHRDKCRLFDAGTEATTWVLNADDPVVQSRAAGLAGRRYGFSVEGPSVPGAFLVGESLTVDFGGGRHHLADVSDLKLLGRHNVANALAATLAACATGTPLDVIRPGIATFPPLPHRLEPVGTVDDVLWVNDSKATNVAATRSALHSLEGPIVLLLGGTDKGEDFRELVPAMLGKVRVALAFGAAGRRIEMEIESEVDVRRVDADFAEIVASARALAHPGDKVVLAPACSSFDMFVDYRDRGDRFRALARAGGS